MKTFIFSTELEIHRAVFHRVTIYYIDYTLSIRKNYTLLRTFIQLTVWYSSDFVKRVTYLSSVVHTHLGFH